MSAVEQARTRMEEARTKIKTRIEAIRGGGSPLGGSILGGNILGQGTRLELPAIKEVRQKGAVKVLEEKFPRVKEMREKGVLARITGLTGSTPSSVSTQAIERGTSSVISEVPLKKETRNISIDMN